MPWLGSTLNEPMKRSGCSRSARRLVSRSSVKPTPTMAFSMPWWSIIARTVATGSGPPSMWGTSVNMYWAGNS